MLVRRGNQEAVQSRQEAKRHFYGRASKWLGTTVVTWSVWALTGAPTGLPRVVSDHHHVVASAGIWPLYVMVGGLADLGRRARTIYVNPVLEAAEEESPT